MRRRRYLVLPILDTFLDTASSRRVKNRKNQVPALTSLHLNMKKPVQSTPAPLMPAVMLFTALAAGGKFFYSES